MLFTACLRHIFFLIFEETGCNGFADAACATEMEQTMDFEELERRVEAAPLQELLYRNASGDFILSNDYTKPTMWSVGHKRPESSLYTWYRARGLRALITMMEQDFPDFRSWLVSFQKECRE